MKASLNFTGLLDAFEQFLKVLVIHPPTPLKEV
jgi:hypothetical protein